METTSRRSIRTMQSILAICVALVAMLATRAGSAQALIPVDPAEGCGQTLNAPGEYVLTGDLPCTGTVSGVVITSSDVTFHLAGHTISNATCDLSQTFAGIFVQGGISRVHIDGGKITGFNDGIILSSSNSLVSGMTVTGACEFGIGVQGERNRLKRNLISANGDGVVLAPARHTVISANNISANTRGVVISDFNSDNNLVKNNIISNNGNGAGGVGVVIANGRRNVIRNNAANNNDNGISIDSPGNLARDNSVNGSSNTGIAISTDGMPSTVRHNTVLGSGVADMSDGSAGCGANVWRNNTFKTDLLVGIPDGGPAMGCIR